MIWYFSRVLGLIGLLGGAVRVGIAVIRGESGGDLLGAVGMGILLIVGGMLVGAILDVRVQIRKRARSREPGRAGAPRKR